MKTTRTVTVTHQISDEQSIILFQTMQKAKDIFSFAANACCKYKTCSYMTLHKHIYEPLKQLYGDMPTALIQSIAKQACASVKSFNVNNKDKKWQYKGNKKSLSLSYNKLCFSKRGNLVALSSVKGRQRFMTVVPQWFIEKYNVKPNNAQAATLKFINGKLQLNLIYNIERDSTAGNDIVGIDRGLYNLATTSKGKIFSSKNTIAVKRRRQFQRKQLQQKGTKSAKRKLKQLSGKEKRFMLDINHQITKSLANDKSVGMYVLEKLTGIRNTKSNKKIRSWLHSWSFYQFEQLLHYKCEYNGIKIDYVDPRYTSQKCNRCKQIDKNARNKSKYVCRHCGYTDHADINAAKNIRDNYVFSQHLNV